MTEKKQKPRAPRRMMVQVPDEISDSVRRTAKATGQPIKRVLDLTVNRWMLSWDADNVPSRVIASLEEDLGLLVRPE